MPNEVSGLPVYSSKSGTETSLHMDLEPLLNYIERSEVKSRIRLELQNLLHWELGPCPAGPLSCLKDVTGSFDRDIFFTGASRWKFRYSHCKFCYLTSSFIDKPSREEATPIRSLVDVENVRMFTSLRRKSSSPGDRKKTSRKGITLQEKWSITSSLTD
ncbi:glutamine synthase clone F11 [Striga asiatica]|uniref:Glutamine synthase clone F11 n=1 Tax=Striga asiatica TaxID=4170 RepID=A0A5A7Q066_STRAF|nr:glutamine synthase clone F11 [Striga asiatica]